jgi:hypothetical protein
MPISPSSSLKPLDGVSAIKSALGSGILKTLSDEVKVYTSDIVGEFFCSASRLIAWLSPRSAKSASARLRLALICFFIRSH